MALRSKKRKRPDYTRAPRPKYRTNDYIRAPKLRVVDSEGALVGVISRDEALAKAKELGVDLVEISPKADPPVAKLIDYGKMLYMLKKKEHQAKKAGKALEQKGVRLTFRMGEGDMERQRQHAQEFLEKGHPLKIQLVMRGRENAHKDLA
ncbi:MAG TPA: translation initiation factor IF-3, partial [Candidatus Gracilibacteria bacterium]